MLDHFVVLAMSPQDTPDEVRANLDSALHTLALQMRACPTLPADPQDPTRHLAQSNSSDCALELPQAHCAFRGCSWTGANIEVLLLHFKDKHLNALQPSMEALQAKVGGLDKSEESLLSSVYNESIAIATRKGAPVASYSIDRRCMTNYVRDLVSDDTCGLICFACARRFPHVPQKRHMNIKELTCSNEPTETKMKPSGSVD